MSTDEVYGSRATGSFKETDGFHTASPYSASKAGSDLLVLAHITPEIKNGMTTSAIYKHAFSFLKKTKYPVAMRYSLRKAVMELGPSGFPFEKYVAEILRRKGYTARTGASLKGFCVTHL